jgi:predicted type IV restriction endonuclease
MQTLGEEMDFKDQIEVLAQKVVKLKEHVQTEEATKNSFIMPFIQILGYDVSDPFEVVPEFTCDIGTKKGEKIDYAIFRDKNAIILIECKHWSQNLSLHDGQLLRYFHVSKARFGILTNGIEYRFYSDLEEKNKMDNTPFFEFNFLDYKDNQVEELKKFHKSYFDIDKILTTASELKYINNIKSLFSGEIEDPSEALVKHFAKQVYPSILMPKVMNQFKLIVKNAINQVINDTITDRLKAALTKEKESDDSKSEASTSDSLTSESKIVTTIEEMEAYYIVKAILRNTIDVKRIVYRDTISYFGILLDDNNRKPICRLVLNENKKYLILLDENKKETKYELNSLEDIFAYSDLIIKGVHGYLK